MNTTDEQCVEALAEIIHKIRSGIRVDRYNVANPLWWCLNDEEKDKCREAARVALDFDSIVPLGF